MQNFVKIFFVAFKDFKQKIQFILGRRKQFVLI